MNLFVLTVTCVSIVVQAGNETNNRHTSPLCKRGLAPPPPPRQDKKGPPPARPMSINSYKEKEFVTKFQLLLNSSRCVGEDEIVPLAKQLWSMSQVFTATHMFKVTCRRFLFGVITIVDHSLAIAPLWSTELLSQPTYNYHRSVIILELVSAIWQTVGNIAYWIQANHPKTASNPFIYFMAGGGSGWAQPIFEDPCTTIVLGMTVERWLAIFKPVLFKQMPHKSVFLGVVAWAIVTKVPYNAYRIYRHDNSPPEVNKTSAPMGPGWSKDVYPFVEICRGYIYLEAATLFLLTISIIAALRRRLASQTGQNKDDIKKQRGATILLLVNAIPYTIQATVQSLLIVILSPMFVYMTPSSAYQLMSKSEAINSLAMALSLIIGLDLILQLTRFAMGLNFTFYYRFNSQFRTIAKQKYGEFMKKVGLVRHFKVNVTFASTSAATQSTAMKPTSRVMTNVPHT